VKPSVLKRIVAFGLALLCGASAGWCAGVSLGQAWAESAPDGWRRWASPVPYRRPSLQGPLPLSADAWALDHYQMMGPPGPATTLSLTVQIPEGGTLTLFPAAEQTPSGAEGPALKLSRDGGSAGVRVRRSRQPLVVEDKAAFQETPLACEGAPPVFGGGPLAVTLTRETSGFSASGDGWSLRCQGGAQGAMTDGAPAIQAGLPRVLVTNLSVDGEATGAPLGGWAAPTLAVAGAAVAALVLALEVWLGAGMLAAALTSLPLLICVLTAGADGNAFLEPTRLAVSSGRWLPLLAGLLPTLGLKLVYWTGRLARAPEAADTRALALKATQAVGMCGGGVVLGVILAQPAHWGAGLYAGLAGAAVGALVWANVNQVRFYNLASLILSLVALGALDFSLRFTDAARVWSMDANLDPEQQDLTWMPTTWLQLEALEDGAHTDYPDEGYPVAYPPRGERPRVVAFGGSSTGGAFQNDDLNQFYPARLEELLADPGVEVLNQGVGSWMTFHVLRYAESNLDDLAPDIITLYVGHNDLRTLLPLPIRELESRWQSGGTSTQMTQVLRRSLLYNGLRFAVQGAAPESTRTAAVPLEHARENLEAVAVLAGARGTKVLLMSEGLNGDPREREAYRAMMAAIADGNPHVIYLDTAAALNAQGSGMFLDDNHLTDAGHRVVAKAAAEALLSAGWLE